MKHPSKLSISKNPRQDRKTRMLLVLVATAMYVCVFIFLSHTFQHRGVSIAVILPVCAVGWFFGLVPGVVAGVLSLPVNILMHELVGLDWMGKLFLQGAALPGTLGLILVGAIVGRISDLTIALREHRDRLDEQARRLQTEIGERNRAIAEEKNIRDHLQNLVETSPDPIIIGDHRGRIVKPNKAFLEMIDYPEEAVLGKMPYEFSVQEPGTYESTAGELVRIEEDFFEKEVRDKAVALVKDGKSSNWMNYYLRKDRKLVPVIQNIVMLSGEKEERTGTFAVIHDITEQRRTARELIRAKERMENLLDNSLDPIVITDNTGLIVRPNKAYLDMLGLTAEEVVGHPSFSYSVREVGTYESTAGETVTIDEEYFQKNSRNIEKLLSDGMLSNWMTYYLSRDGKVIPVAQNTVLVSDEQGERILNFAIMRDITEQRKSELEMIASREAAIEANMAKSNFLANMSHEIRTPMNGVIGFTDMLLEADLDPELEDYAKMIKRSGEALMSLINDILDFSKIEAGKIEIEEIVFDLEMLAYDVCELIRPRKRRKSVEILCRIADTLPARVCGDPYRFRQVLVNLMANAAKFTEQGEIELTLDVQDEQARRVLIHSQVRDTGIGIPQDRLDNIFDAFQQADGSTTRKYGGTGLGLSISRKIAKLMGGDVWAENLPEGGSSFHFTAWLGMTDVRPKRAAAPVALVDKKVLITEDNPTNIDILCHTLEAAGMRPFYFMRGEAALQAIQEAAAEQDPYDICILDIMMSGMNGYELAREIRRLHGDSPPLLAFSSAMEDGVHKCQESGFDGFLPKPINRKKLLKMMERLIGESAEGVWLEQAGGRQIVTQHSLREEDKHTTCILLVEDNLVNQKLAEKLLTKAGYNVVLADNGQSAVDMFKGSPERFDIVFMDIQMPVLNGIEATQAIRDWEARMEQAADPETFCGPSQPGSRPSGSKPRIPIIAMTANAMKGDREKCLGAGMDDYIPKPIKREVVFETLRQWVFERTAEKIEI